MIEIKAKEKDLKSVNEALRKSVNDNPVQVFDAEHLHGLAAGLKQGEITIDGSCGDYLGVLNAGAKIIVENDVGKYLADNMNSGTIVVKGNAGFGAGMYCYGGTIVIHGNAGDFTGSMNKGADIIVAGDVGDEAGTYMLAGNLIVVGNAGKNFANFLIRGSVFIGGQCESEGHNLEKADLSPDDIEKLQGYFSAFGIQAEAKDFIKFIAASEKPFYH